MVLHDLYFICFKSPSMIFDMLISGSCVDLQSNLHVTVTSAVAAAVVWMSEFPTRLTPIILPLMASIKREQVLV